MFHQHGGEKITTVLSPFGGELLLYGSTNTKSNPLNVIFSKMHFALFSPTVYLNTLFINV